MNKIAKLRAEKGITQSEMAKILGVGAPTLSQYESGQRSIPIGTAKKIATILDVEIKDIFLPIRYSVSKTEKESV